MGKITLGIGFAAGYVLGSRAGRERYEQIVDMAQSVANKPQVQKAADSVQGVAKDTASKTKDKVSDTVKSKTGGSSDDLSTGVGTSYATTSYESTSTFPSSTTPYDPTTSLSDPDTGTTPAGL